MQAGWPDFFVWSYRRTMQR